MLRPPSFRQIRRRRGKVSTACEVRLPSLRNTLNLSRGDRLGLRLFPFVPADLFGLLKVDEHASLVANYDVRESVAIHIPKSHAMGEIPVVSIRRDRMEGPGFRQIVPIRSCIAVPALGDADEFGFSIACDIGEGGRLCKVFNAGKQSVYFWIESRPNKNRQSLHHGLPAQPNGIACLVLLSLWSPADPEV